MKRRSFLAGLIAAPVAAKVEPKPFVGLAPRYTDARYISTEWIIVWGDRTVDARIVGASPSSK